MSNSISLIAILSLFTLLPFIIASGTYFIKFSIVFVIVRNALGLQQVPSNMTLNGVALLLSMFVMMPVGKEIYYNSQNENLSFNNVASVVNFVETGMSGYKSYLIKYSESELVNFFEKIQKVNSSEDNEVIFDDDNISIFSLLPAYALSEIKSAFIIGFYIYLPFVVVDLVISSVLLTLGMMIGFAPIFPDTCYHLTHYWPAAADIPVASDNPVHYADAIRYNARTPLQGSLLPLTRLV